MDISNYNIEQCDAVSVLNAIMDMHDHPQKIDQIAAAISPIAAAAAAYSEGKPQLAQAITAKGVTTAADASLATMAANIRSIQQETIEIDGGEMYAKQLYGVKDNSIVPGYWNLYEVMAYLLSKTSSEQYSILLCEIPKGDAEYTFGTAVTPGSTPMGYVFSDDWQLNGEGSLYIHDATEAGHTWNDDLDMKGNRWVAWLFAQVVEGATAPMVSLGAAATTCPQPRSIHIGRHMGTITATANGVLSEIVVTDGNVLAEFNTGSYTQNWNKKIVLRNISNLNEGALRISCEGLYIECNRIGSGLVINNSSVRSIVVKANSIGNNNITFNFTPESAAIYCPSVGGGGLLFSAIPHDFHLKTESYNIITGGSSGTKIVTLDYISNDKTKSVSLPLYNGTPSSDSIITLANGWCKPLNISGWINLTEENMYAHILQHLKQDEPDCGDGVTITLGSTNLAKLTSEESVALLQSLRSTYGYTIQ